MRVLGYLSKSSVWLIPLIFICALLLSAQLLRVPISPESQIVCIQAAKQSGNKHPNCPTEQSLWTRGLSDPIAYFTLWLTLFTAGLASISWAQWNLLNQQIRLARDEFSATHRPKIITRSFEYAHSDGKPAVAFVFANIGDIETQITEIGTCVSDNSNPGKIFSVEQGTFKTPLSPGDRRTSYVVDERIKSQIDTYITRPNFVGDQYLIGYIRYISGKRAYHTGFCRKFNPENGRWVRQTESEFEYVD